MNMTGARIVSKVAASKGRQRAERSHETRRRLLVAAYDSVASDGYHGLTLNAVTSRAGVSKGALVYHFPDKEALILATLEWALEQAGAAFPPGIPDAGNPAEPVLRSMLAEFGLYFRSESFRVVLSIALEVSGIEALDKSVRASVAAHHARIRQAWAQRLMSAGCGKDAASRAARSAAAFASGSALQLLWDAEDGARALIEDEWIRQCLTGLR